MSSSAAPPDKQPSVDETAQPSSPLPEVPGFQIHRLLAHGGTAEVYLATQESLGREVALKLLSPQQADDSFTERFIKEGQIIAGLNHPNIITIFDIGVLADGQHYIAMEYLEGGDLERQLNGQPFPELQAVVILRELAACLQFVHEQGIIHRDIKPANVLFRKNGSLVLTDFGIAKLMEDDVKLTQTGATIGSPAYSSPEQAQGLTLDRRTDLYSLGVLFLEMLLGYNPYKAETFATTSINHIQMPVPQLESKLRQYQPLIDGLLAKNPADRFSSAEALMDFLQNPPRQPWLNVKALSNRLNAKWLLPALGVLLVLAGLATFWGMQANQQHQTLNALLAEAEVRIAEDQWLEPAGDSAHFYYLKMLELDPNNKVALAGEAALISGLLEKAADAMNNKRLMKPLRRNAYYYFQQVLSLEATNKAALEGIASLVDAYVTLGDKAIAEDRLTVPKGNNAYYYYTQAMEIDSNSIQANQGMKKLVNRYLELAEQAKQEHKLLTPKGESAVDYYKRVQEIDPRNAAAKKGIEDLANHYALLAKGAREKGERDKMVLYVNRGLSLDPYNTQLIKLQAEAQQSGFLQRMFSK